ncbi:SDR family NAD(P)-dependent oxidoreductase [Thermasporomyces composti]|jgi:hypothetical protein|uniref:Short-subunit dehydrogenase n=1 Tax=Thermasporomyces composti TaxID=696763 RepID=A0A3D9V2R7_THECX|nr:SDR family oxidoreductase [Thermasporomyces composti]REF36102.1 hypothetical protein DFJ64_1500 [Thermasporomyces composti]
MPTALITGSTAGIGRAFAEALAARRYDLVLVARDLTRLGAVAEELSSRYTVHCDVLSADLAEPAAVRAVENRIADTSPDLLVNNAGFGLGSRFLDTPVEEEERLLDVLVRAVLRLTRAALPSMVARGSGAVVNVSSVAGFAPYGTYGAAKAWVTSFTEAVANEVAGTGVRVVAVCPGFVRTEFHQRSGAWPKGLPGWMWLTSEDVVSATLRHLDAGRTSPVLVPTLRYRLVAGAARHLPRPLVRSVSRSLRMRRR